jgi:hypothetical protein
MPRFSRLQAGFALFLIWESACQKKQAVVPVPSPPAATLPASTQAPATPAAAGSQPPDAVTTTHAQEATPYQVNKPAQPTPAAKKPPRTAAAPAPAAAPSTPAAPPAPAAPAPKLGDILTPDERKQINAAIDQSLSHAQASLNSVGGRQLSKDQQAQVEQIRNFIGQAQATRGSDPSGARSLSERAEVLARDLVASFR